MNASTTRAHCHRCGRAITSAASIGRRYGSGCWAIVRRAGRRLNDLLAAFTARQADDAAELIEDAAIIPTALAAVFRTVSHDGQRVYLTTRNACTCPARAGCFHRAAVIIHTA